MSYPEYGFATPSRRSAQSYFDYVAERHLGVRAAPIQPEVVEFSGFESYEVSEIPTVTGSAGGDVSETGVDRCSY